MSPLAATHKHGCGTDEGTQNADASAAPFLVFGAAQVGDFSKHVEWECFGGTGSVKGSADAVALNVPAHSRHFSLPSARRSGVVLSTADEGDPSTVRQARSAGGQVMAQPVDCVLSEWSAWSRCDTCQKKRVSAPFQRDVGGNCTPEFKKGIYEP